MSSKTLSTLIALGAAAVVVVSVWVAVGAPIVAAVTSFTSKLP